MPSNLPPSDLTIFLRYLFVINNGMMAMIGCVLLLWTIMKHLYPSLITTILQMEIGLNVTTLRYFLWIQFSAAVFLFLMSCCGCIGAMEHHAVLLTIYALVHIAMTLFILGAALDVWLFQDKLRHLLNIYITKIVTRDLSTNPDDFTTNVLLHLQDTMSCCGANNHTDYGLSGWRSLVRKKLGVTKGDYIPLSCCRVDSNKPEFPVLINKQNCTLPTAAQQKQYNITLYNITADAKTVWINPNGCYETVLTWFTNNYELLILLLLICVISECFLIGISIYLLRNRRQKCHSNVLDFVTFCQYYAVNDPRITRGIRGPWNRRHPCDAPCSNPKTKERLYCEYLYRRRRTRFIFLLFQIFIMFIGVAFIWVGAEYKVDLAPIKFITIVVPKMDDPYKQYFTTMPIIIGVILTMLSLIGMAVYSVDRNCYYYWYAVYSVGAFCIALACGIFVFTFKYRVGQEIDNKLQRFVAENVTIDDTDKLTTLFFLSQYKLQCCGFVNYTDYEKNLWQTETKRIKKPASGFIFVPWTCCVWPRKYENTTNGLNSDTCESIEPNSNPKTRSLIVTDGCYEKLRNFLFTHTSAKITTIFFVCCFLVVGTTLAINLVRTSLSVVV